MKRIKLSDIELLDIGNSIQLSAAVYSGKGLNYICVLPAESADDIDEGENFLLPMNLDEWKEFLRQADIVEVHGPEKAILRKSQRQIDPMVSWEVFRRDNFMCRYTGDRTLPLTVDHIITWEEGGPTIPENLVACTKRANKMRGNMPYEEWIVSEQYKQISRDLTTEEKLRNIEIVNKLPHLRTLKVKSQRSR